MAQMILGRIVCRCFSSSQVSLDPRYAIHATCLLQRPPIITKRSDALEAAYGRYQWVLEGERSRGRFRIDSPGDRQDSEAPDASSLTNSIQKYTDEGVDGDDVKEGGQGVEEMIEAAVREYEGAVTGKGDLRRQLDRKLFLFVRKDGKWSLPSQLVSDDKSPIHQVARSGLQSMFDVSNADIYWTGASPAAYHLEAFKGRTKTPLGIKHFVFRGQLIGGRFGQSKGIEEFAWLTREEAREVLDESFYSSIEPVLSY